MLLNLLVIIVLLGGLVFFTGGTVGILRLPDFYTRLHAAGKMDTLGSLLTMLALALFNLHDFTFHGVLTSLKIMLAVVFVFLASPTATHAIVDAGVRAGLMPWTREKGEKVIWLDLTILTLVVICGLGAIMVRDLLGAAVLFGAYSFMMCLLWSIMGAVDVAFTEASVGAGVSTVFFVAAVFRTSRRTKD